MTETDFKVGDKAEITAADLGGEWQGQIVTVIEANRRAGGGSFDLRVERADGQNALVDSHELKLVEPEPKFKKGDIVKSVGFQYRDFRNKTLIVDHLNDDDVYYYAVRALGTDYEKGHNFREDELVAGEPLAQWEIELLDYRSPKYPVYLAEYAVADVKATELMFAKSALIKNEAVKPLKIYLAGPMSGIEHYNFPAFFTAARKLRKAGHTVFNPAENDLATGFNALGMEGHEAADHGFSLRDALKTDLSWICENAEALVLLEGWEGSKGVRAEMALAEALGLPKYEMAKLPITVAK